MRKSSLLSWIILLVFVLSIVIVPAAADSSGIPKAFWKLSPLYEKAVKENNNNNIILYGRQIIDLFKGKSETSQVLGIITPRLLQIAKAYEALGQYDSATANYKQYIPRAEKLGWKDGAAYAKTKLLLLDFDIQLYAKSTNPSNIKYFGAKYEPKSGAYFGSTYDLDPRIGSYKWEDIKNYFTKKNSAYLIYLEWGDKINRYDRHYQSAKQDNTAVQIGWNISDSTIAQVTANIENYRSYIEETAQYLKELNMPVFLRFASEMNIKKNSTNTENYVKAFRYVASIMKTKAPNVAMVWVPGDINAKGRTYESYYPGDEYVDWVGVSTYVFPYFQGKKNWGSLQDTIDSVYMTGNNVNPIAKLKPLYDLYGSRKPFLISECGVSHYTKHEQENVTEWAKIQMRRLYAYAPMVYPNLKAMFYFNVEGDTLTPHDNFALYDNAQMNALYNELTSKDNYLSNIGAQAPYTFEKVLNFSSSDLNLQLYTYTIVPKLLTPTIRYKVDGKSYGEYKEIPYTWNLDCSSLTKGNHVLTVEILNGSKLIKTKQYKLIVNTGNVTLKSN